MKKLFVLTAVAIVTVAALGCQNCGLFRRGSLFPTTAATVGCGDPCAPCNSCNSSATADYGDDYGGLSNPVLPSPVTQ
jgi:hypothetical protein